MKIHVKQFEKANGRRPDAEELVRIMRSEANLSVPGLPGSSANDQFKIDGLARSIATNGVRTPPVIAHDGTLLDGNRRVTACLHVLQSDGFELHERERAKTIRVWQLPEDAGEDDINAVVVSLNFEPDYKEDWPEYVKARKVYDEWRALLELFPGASGSKQAQLKRELARRFATTPTRVTRYVSMVELADEFEEYHRNERGRDEFEVQHAADRYFQYFDELGKGRGDGGVYWSMNQDDSFKQLVFDLLHDGKFRNYTQIRDLRHVYQNEEATEYLDEARDHSNLKTAQGLVADGLAAGLASRAVERQVGGNKRIEVFVKWLLDAPVSFFSTFGPGSIKRSNLKRLYAALKFVAAHIPADVRREVDRERDSSE